MYDRFFGLGKSPFSMTPNPDALLLTDAHREALAGLGYAIVQRKGFVVLEGEAGTGKTTLLRKLLQMLPDTQAQTSVVLNPVLSAAEFLELLLHNFGLTDLPASKAQRLIRLEEVLLEANRAGKAPVLMIDEAHKLSREVLEEIRLLTNFETNDQKLLQIVLSGQPELKDLLNHPDLRQLKQRVAVRLRIQNLTPIEVKEYLLHRWAWAEATTPLPFTGEAVSLIALWSRGIPRLINSICDNALLLAFSTNSETVGPALILEVVKDLDLGMASENGQAKAHRAITSGHHPAPVAALAPAPARHENEVLRLGTLDRYMPAQRGFLGIRWRPKGLVTTNNGY
jgi:general secretion pathway protein A